jgi:sialate O-acetylesterase
MSNLWWKLTTAWVALGLALTPADLLAVKVHGLFSNGAVLQQGVKVPVWGSGAEGEKISVTIQGQEVQATTHHGKWSLQLEPLHAGGPFTLIIKGSNAVVIHNILVGEVWLCSGQSNMDMELDPNGPNGRGGVINAQQEIASANFPRIRLFQVKKQVASKPLAEVEGGWRQTTPQTVALFSAVGYFFGRELHETLGVPIGLIQASYGGSPAEAWISRKGLEQNPDLNPILAGLQRTLVRDPGVFEAFMRRVEQWIGPARKAEAEGKPMPPFPWIPPTGFYNGMIAPLSPYAMRGVIWYQGEANTGSAEQYAKLFPAMIRDWRDAWAEGDFPFLFVQLPNYEQTEGPESSWAQLRESQRIALSLPRTGMAVTIDIGDPHSVHPKNKQEVGRRLALAALGVAYGSRITFSGPVYESARAEGGVFRLRFKHVGGDLVVKGDSQLTGFEIAGEDRKFVPARARIDRGTVIVWSDEVPRPRAVRYGWADNPLCNLSNRAGLPASPFQTDPWPLRVNPR